MTTTTDRRRGPRGRIRYLCCTCGTQRTASMNYHPTPPTGVEEPQGARWLQWLKCETCDAAGWHAGLSSDHPALTVGGDHEEDLNRAHDRDRRRVNRLLLFRPMPTAGLPCAEGPRLAPAGRHARRVAGDCRHGQRGP